MENSIQHRLRDRMNRGKVDILITERLDYIEAVVAGNGVGFPEDPGQPARRNTPIPKASIGLKDVEERLRLFYRKEDMLYIQRAEGITKITLKLYRSDRHQEERVMLRVILADDKQYERNYLEKAIKENYPGLLEIVYKAMDGVDLMERSERHKLRIVLLDIKMPQTNGLKIAEKVCRRHPNV